MISPETEALIALCKAVVPVYTFTPVVAPGLLLAIRMVCDFAAIHVTTMIMTSAATKIELKDIGFIGLDF
jgi:hypothetical protein